MLEIPIGSLSEVGDASSSASRGLSKEAWDALPSVRFTGPDYDADALALLSVSELKRVMEVHGISDAGCIERHHLVEKLLEKFVRPAAADSSAGLPRISQPAACAICMSNFRDGEVLRCACAAGPARPGPSPPHGLT